MSSPQSSNTELSSAAPSSLFSRRSPSGGIRGLAVVPPRHTARTLVFCFPSNSGIGRKYRTRHSNVLNFLNLLNQHDNNQQMCLCLSPWEVDGLDHHHCFDRALILADKNFALCLDLHIEQSYADLAHHYQPGDKVSFFGFSRGAYTARALAEMIHKVGLLGQQQIGWVPWAYSLYLRDVDGDWHALYETFRETCHPTKIVIDFVGVWDTVSSIGEVIPCTLPFTKSNTSIRVFRQALALHEPRFDAQDAQDRTDVQEVWFAGSHCDVGGCAAPDDTPHSLGRLSLRWMVRECFRANTGIQFLAEKLGNIGLDPTSLYPIVKERPTPLQPHYYHSHTLAPCVPTASEEEHDVRDALAPMHDQLAVYTPLWWLMEFSPMRRRIPLGPPSDRKDGSEETIRMPLPRALFLPKHHSQFYVHPTVYTREKAKYRTPLCPLIP